MEIGEIDKIKGSLHSSLHITVLLILMFGLIPWCAWATLSIANRPDRADIMYMIQSQSPYTRDRDLLMNMYRTASEERSNLNEAMISNNRLLRSLLDERNGKNKK